MQKLGEYRPFFSLRGIWYIHKFSMKIHVILSIIHLKLRIVSQLWTYMYPSVHPSVRYGGSAEVIWPHDTRSYISGPRALEGRTRQSLWAPALALATGTNTSFLDGLYKTKQQMGTYIQWPAVKQAARFMRRHGPSGNHGGSRFWLWLLAFSSLARGVTSKLTTFWTVDWFSHHLHVD